MGLTCCQRQLWGPEGRKGGNLGPMTRTPLCKGWGAVLDATYGTRNSMTLLMLCLSSMMMAIWMKRSVMQPLGWHCEGTAGLCPASGTARPGGCLAEAGAAVGSRGSPSLAGQRGRESRTVVRGQSASQPGPHLLQPPPASDAHVVPRVAVDPAHGSTSSEV